MRKDGHSVGHQSKQERRQRRFLWGFTWFRHVIAHQQASFVISPLGARGGGGKPIDTSVGVVPWRQPKKEELRLRQELKVTRRGGKSVNILSLS